MLMASVFIQSNVSSMTLVEFNSMANLSRDTIVTVRIQKADSVCFTGVCM